MLKTAIGQPREVLSCKLGQEEYGINILAVQELRGYDAVTRIANAPEFVKGVINLRGVIVPIIDLRIKFGLLNPTYDTFTVVVIINLPGRTAGIVVDSVSDVVELSPEQIKPAPELVSSADDAYILGLATLEERILILVDIEKLLSSSEIEHIQIAA